MPTRPRFATRASLSLLIKKKKRKKRRVLRVKHKFLAESLSLSLTRARGIRNPPFRRSREAARAWQFSEADYEMAFSVRDR